MMRAHVERDDCFTEGFIVQQFIAGSDVSLSIFARSGAVVAACTFRCGPRSATEFDSATTRYRDA
jgi:predicted ATP-grasp superfamily ATP-dependent carboligase